MVKGIHDYYSNLIHQYEKLKDEDVINLLTHDIEEDSYSDDLTRTLTDELNNPEN